MFKEGLRVFLNVRIDTRPNGHLTEEDTEGVIETAYQGATPSYDILIEDTGVTCELDEHEIRLCEYPRKIKGCPLESANTCIGCTIQSGQTGPGASTPGTKAD